MIEKDRRPRKVQTWFFSSLALLFKSVPRLFLLSLALCLFTLRSKFTHTHTVTALVCVWGGGGSEARGSECSCLISEECFLGINACTLPPQIELKTFLLCFVLSFFLFFHFFFAPTVNKNKYRKFVFHSAFLFALPPFFPQAAAAAPNWLLRKTQEKNCNY